MKIPVRLLGWMLLLAGCASQHDALVLDAVGPAPVRSQTATPMGSLLVYTAFDVHANLTGGFPERRHYTDYKLLSDNGKLLQTVHNDEGNVVESPVSIELPAGRYRVVARASRYGTVTLPVVIVPHECTTVHLDGTAGNIVASSSTNEVVRLPNGQIVGWRDNNEKLAGTASPVAASR